MACPSTGNAFGSDDPDTAPSGLGGSQINAIRRVYAVTSMRSNFGREAFSGRKASASATRSRILDHTVGASSASMSSRSSMVTVENPDRELLRSSLISAISRSSSSIGPVTCDSTSSASAPAGWSELTQHAPLAVDLPCAAGSYSWTNRRPRSARSLTV